MSTQSRTLSERFASAENSRDTRRRFLAKAGLAASGLVLGMAPFRSSLLPAAQDCQLVPPPSAGQEQRAQAYQFPSTDQPRVRKSLFDVVASPADLANLMKAYQALKDLQAMTPDSPINWCNQANVHYNHCSFPPPNPQYYQQIHFGWLFLPWHRAYLYFYESILRSLSNQPSFALPYWDWTNNPTIPDVFFDPSSPLFDSRRGPGKGQSMKDDQEVYATVEQSNIDYILSQQNFSDFGGPPDSTESDANLQGLLEGSPHDAVHSWTGTQAPPYYDMGSFDAAARDLLFFAHHANIDRLWDSWRQTPGHNNPTDSVWLNQWFNFWAPDGGVVSVTVQDTVSTKLNVVYQPPTITLALATPTQELAGKPITSEKITLPEAFRAKLTGPMLPVAQLHRTTVRVHVLGFEAPANVALRLRVFLNKPDASATTSLDDPHYAGTIFVVPMRAAAGGMAGPMHPPHALSLDVTRKIIPLLQKEPQPTVTVTLVPVGLDKKASTAKVKFKSTVLKVVN